MGNYYLGLLIKYLAQKTAAIKNSYKSPKFNGVQLPKVNKKFQ